MKNYFDFVEIRTKLASVVPFFIGLFYVFYTINKINFVDSVLLFVAMLSFDMATTAINNAIGTREKHSSVKPHYSDAMTIAIILFLVIIAISFGVYLSFTHGILLLLTGAFCFFVGIFYSFGPAPIFRTPYGEIVSGTVEGFCIPFMVVLINFDPKDFILLNFNHFELNMIVQVDNVAKVVLLTLPIIFSIANIMLANNICDVEEDAKNQRFTLPYFIGKQKSLLLFKHLYTLADLSILLCCYLKIVPITCLLSVFLLGRISKNVKTFSNFQEKSTTFGLSVLNFVLVCVPFALLILIGALFKL